MLETDDTVNEAVIETRTTKNGKTLKVIRRQIDSGLYTHDIRVEGNPAASSVSEKKLRETVETLVENN